jgi:NodT family efflux transporter outer membrane factor (OMF) lipoprotein
MYAYDKCSIAGMRRSMKYFFNIFSNRLYRYLGALLIVFIITACKTVGPNYSSPEMQTPASWNQTVAEVNGDKQADQEVLAKWWATFNDPILSSLMERAVAGNLNLKQALSNVTQARIQRGITDTSRIPTVNGTGSVGRSYSKDFAGDFTGTNSFRAGLDASWELDIFGGVKRSIEAADANIQATKESYRDALVSLLAEVALNYIDVRSYQSRLQVAESNVKSQEETYNITKWRHQAGLITELDEQNAAKLLEQTRSQIPSLKSGLEQAKNRIAVLLGSEPGAVDSELEEYKAVPVTPESIALGIPADLLRRRPDLRKAERSLAVQTARIGVAEADRYPKISLSGNIGLSALTLGKFFSTDGLTTGVSSGISWPVYQAGKIAKNIELQWAIREQQLIAYKAALLTALQDVENALIAYSYEQTRRESLSKEVEFARQAADISKSQYSSGLIDFQSVLEAQTTLTSAQDQLAQSDAQVISNLISLYKALGGGWSSFEEAHQG